MVMFTKELYKGNKLYVSYIQFKKRNTISHIISSLSPLPSLSLFLSFSSNFYNDMLPIFFLITGLILY